MTDRVVLREYLCSLGFEVKKSDEAKFNNWLDGAKKAVAGLAAAFAAYKIAEEFNKITASFEQLLLLSKRTGASVGGLRSFAFAMEQMGVAGDAATSTLEELNRKILDTNGGMEQWLSSQLGVKLKDATGKLRDMNDVVLDIGDALADVYNDPKKGPGLAWAMAQEAGIHDYQEFLALMDKETRKFAEKSKKRAAAFGLDPETFSKTAQSIQRMYRTIGDITGTLFAKLAQMVGPTIQKILDRLSNFLEAHAPEIGKLLTRFESFINDYAEKFFKWLDTVDIEKFWKDFTKGVENAWQGLKGLTKDLREIWTMIKDAAAFLGYHVGVGGAQAGESEPGVTSGEDERPKEPGPPPGGDYDPSHHPRYDPKTGKVTPWNEGGAGSPDPGIVPKTGAGGSTPLGPPSPSPSRNLPGGGGRRSGGAYKGNLAANQREAYAAAIESGLSHDAAMALVANMTGEALHKPNDYHWDVHHMARGIVQWDPQRSEAIKRQFGRYPNEMSVADQTKAAIWEIRNNPRFAATRNALEGGGSPEGMIGALVRNYENPRDHAGEISKRVGNLRRLGDLRKPAPAQTAATEVRKTMAGASGQNAAAAAINADPHGFGKPIGYNPAMQAAPSAANQSTVNQNITINGQSEPQETARILREHQTLLAGRLTRDLQGSAQ